MLGVIEDVTRRTPSAWSAAGERVFLLGETREELSGSEWAHVVHGHLGGLPPAVDLAAERSLAELLREGVGLLTSAHDLSDGGLAQALVETSLRHGIGVSVVGRRRRVRRVCSASRPRRVLVTVPDGDAERLVELAARHGGADHRARRHRRRRADASTGSSSSRSPSCATPGPRRCRLRWAEAVAVSPVNRGNQTFSAEASPQNVRDCPNDGAGVTQEDRWRQSGRRTATTRTSTPS